MSTPFSPHLPNSDAQTLNTNGFEKHSSEDVATQTKKIRNSSTSQNDRRRSRKLQEKFIAAEHAAGDVGLILAHLVYK